MKLRWAKGLRGIAVFALLLVAARSYGQAQAEGHPQTAAAGAPVVAVRIVTEDGRVLSESPKGLTIEIGKPLNREQVAQSLRALYGLGDFRWQRGAARFRGSTRSFLQ
jgi:outer membrane protein assembly factor BamA